MNNNRQKEKAQKLGFDLIPSRAFEGLAKVLEFGATKHGSYSWKGYPIVNYVDAIQRHLLAIRNGEWLDKESGLPHAHHIMTSAAILGEFEHVNPVAFNEYIALKKKAVECIEGDNSIQKRCF